MVGFCLAIPGAQARADAAYPAQPHAGRAAGISRRRRGPRAQAGAARRSARRAASSSSSGPSIRSNSRTPTSISNGWARWCAATCSISTAPPRSPLHGGLPTDRCVAEWWLARAPRRGCARRRHPRANGRAGAYRSAGVDRYPAQRGSASRPRNSGGRERTLSRCISRAAWPSRASNVRGLRNLPVGTMAFTIDRIVLRQISMPLVHFFETSFGRTTDRADPPGRSRSPTASPAGEKSPPARIPSTTKSGPNRPG